LEQAKEEMKALADQFLGGEAGGWLKQVEKQQVEAPFSFCLEDVVLDGKFDWLGGRDGKWTHLLDYKTGKNIPPAKVEEYQLQLGLYALALQLAGHTPLRVGIYYVDEDRLETFDSASLAQQARQTASPILMQIRNGDFAARPGAHCAFCPQAQFCPHGLH